jgi:heterodisulfide reductase subunit A
VDKGNTIKTGVFICSCEGKIADVLDVAALEKGVKGTHGVTLVQPELYGCSKKGLRNIREAIKEYGLNRLVVAGCTPRTHEPLFKAALEEAGLNGSLFEMVNIREQCAWVHAEDGAGAISKALDLIRMGIAKAVLRHPTEKTQVEVTRAALVIGGGIAGLTAALTVAKGGFPVKLVEKENELGGLVGSLHTLYPNDENARGFIKKKAQAVKEHPAIEIFTGAEVADVDGSIGSYRITIEQGGESCRRDVGAVIVAIGARELKLEDTSRHGGTKVITQLELEQILQAEGVDAHHVAMILDTVAMRYDSSVCAAVALKNSILLKRKDPRTEVSLLFRNFGAGLDGRKIKEAKDLGIHLIKYNERQRPQVKDDAVEVYDELRGEEISIPCDLVVLGMPLVPQDDAAKISVMLRTPLDANGFFLEPGMRLRPRSYLDDAIFICGSAHYPVDVQESAFQAYRAAANTLHHLSRSKVNSETASARVVDSRCTGCGTCVEACAFKAIAMEEREGTLGLSRIDALLCKGCGNCTVVCPAKAIVMEPYTDRELIAQINAALAVPRDGEIRILGLLCEWSGYAAADLAGAQRLQYPCDLRIIRLGCSARFDPHHVLWAFLNGADGVLVGACEPGACHCVNGNRYAEERVMLLREMLERTGLDRRRLSLRWFKPDDAQAFVDSVNDFTSQIEYLGPSAVCPDEMEAWDSRLMEPSRVSETAPAGAM